MGIISGYFVSRQQAQEAADYLHMKGFKGQISIIGRNSEEEDLDKTDNLTNNTLVGMSDYGATWGFGIPIFGVVGGSLGNDENGVLNHWGVPKKEREEIKRVINSGNSVILIKSEENEKQFVSNVLKYKGAQNIHS